MTRARTRPVAAAAPLAVDSTDEQLTDAQLADARVWMQAARAWVIERYPYLDTALTSMLLVPRIGLGTVAVDARWRLYYDPARVLQVERAHGIAALGGDWVHEVMHLLRDHPARWQDLREEPSRQPLFNIAGDALVNADVADLDLPILDTDITFDRLPKKAGCTRAMATEEIYARLLPHVQVTETGGPGPDCGSGSGGEQRPWEESLADGHDDGAPDSGRAEIIREETARSIRAARKEEGTVPSGLRVWADALLDPSVDWRVELRSVVSRRLGQAAGVTDYSFGRLARRRVAGYTLPGMVGPAPPRVAAVIDTSGSMGPPELAQCLGDLLGLSRAVGGTGAAVTVMTCDAAVREVQAIRNPGQVREITLTGGGGTDMTVGLQACADLRPIPEVVVVMTDGFTPWPPAPPVGLERTRVIALLTTDELARHVPGWIHVITVT